MVSNINTNDKLKLLNGKDFWTTHENNGLGIKSIVFADGPTGLRFQEGENDHLGMNKSKTATCFPTAAALSCSWNTELIEEVAACIAKEAIEEGVDVVLGPGINIKRSPLCGRNFEYFSEDPHLTKEIAVAFVNGLQNSGVGASLKHFACNNQEDYRMSIDTLVDERALFEIYLKVFEDVIKSARPWTVMTAYNKLLGSHCSENSWLLKDILRTKWGFEGLVVSDWYAVNGIVNSINNGLDLEMPGVGSFSYNLLKDAYDKGILKEQEVDRAVNCIIELSNKCNNAIKSSTEKANPEKHHEIARNAAVESIVMLKNEKGILPLKPTDKILFVGELMSNPVIQGHGSSRVNPGRIDSIHEELNKAGIKYAFEPGYSLNDGNINPVLIQNVINAVGESDKVVFFAGLNEIDNAESYDRENLKLPDCQERLIDLIAIAGKKLIIVLQTGSAVEMPWVNKAHSILQMHLSGQGAGKALVDIISGQISPSGKLTETYPKKLANTPSFLFKGSSTLVEYSESIFVGYKYYDKKMLDVQFPFGHGLSYSDFEYSGLKVIESGNDIEVSFYIKNIGSYEAKEITQVYISLNENLVIQPVRKLAAFRKISLLPGEKKEVVIILSINEFKYYDTNQKEWVYATGINRVEVGKSSRDIVLVDIMGLSKTNKKYNPIDDNTTIGELKKIPCLKSVIDEQIGQILNELSFDTEEIINHKEFEKTLFFLPLRNIIQVTGGEFSIQKLNSFIEYLNSILKEAGVLYEKQP